MDLYEYKERERGRYLSREIFVDSISVGEFDEVGLRHTRSAQRFTEVSSPLSQCSLFSRLLFQAERFLACGGAAGGGLFVLRLLLSAAPHVCVWLLRVCACRALLLLPSTQPPSATTHSLSLSLPSRVRSLPLRLSPCASVSGVCSALSPATRALAAGFGWGVACCSYAPIPLPSHRTRYTPLSLSLTITRCSQLYTTHDVRRPTYELVLPSPGACPLPSPPPSPSPRRHHRRRRCLYFVSSSVQPPTPIRPTPTRPLFFSSSSVLYPAQVVVVVSYSLLLFLCRCRCCCCCSCSVDRLGVV